MAMPTVSDSAAEIESLYERAGTADFTSSVITLKPSKPD
jgi:hypothetical protein